MASILVVDDEDSIREVLTRRLRGWGHEVVAVGSAAEALTQMEVSQAAIVFCDLIMPVHDGFWLLEQIRERWPEMILVVVSAAEELATVMKTRQYGPVDYVPKPVGREMLYQALQRALARLESRRL